jgi:hypothetical protein
VLWDAKRGGNAGLGGHKGRPYTGLGGHKGRPYA